MAFWTVVLVVLVAFLFPCVAAYISDTEHEASRKMIVLLQDTISESNREKEDPIRKLKAQSSDLLNISAELYELKGDMDDLLDDSMISKTLMLI
jgi:hypothetical protein